MTNDGTLSAINFTNESVLGNQLVKTLKMAEVPKSQKFERNWKSRGAARSIGFVKNKYGLNLKNLPD